MQCCSKAEISSEILQNAAKEEPTIEAQEGDQQKIECISHLIPEKKQYKDISLVEENDYSYLDKMKADMELPNKPQIATQHCDTPSSQNESLAICKSSPSS